MGTQLIEIKGEIKENWKFNGQLRVNYINSIPMTNVKKTLKSRVDIQVRQGQKLHKIGSLGSIRGAIKRN
jgi:hypothetical protein